MGRRLTRYDEESGRAVGGFRQSPGRPTMAMSMSESEAGFVCAKPSSTYHSPTLPAPTNPILRSLPTYLLFVLSGTRPILICSKNLFRSANQIGRSVAARMTGLFRRDRTSAWDSSCAQAGRARSEARAGLLPDPRHRHRYSAFVAANNMCLESHQRTAANPVSLLWLLLLCGPLFGVDPDRRIDQLYHTGWTMKDGPLAKFTRWPRPTMDTCG